jgi:hypothetical protein
LLFIIPFVAFVVVTGRGFFVCNKREAGEKNLCLPRFEFAEGFV